MKKILFLAMATMSLGIQAESLTLEIGDCVLIKENKLKKYLPEEKVVDFLSQPYNVKIVHEDKEYKMELIQTNKKKRYKQYKVCVNSIKK